MIVVLVVVVSQPAAVPLAVVAPPLVAPPLVAPPLVAPPLVAPPLVAPPLVAPLAVVAPVLLAVEPVAPRTPPVVVLVLNQLELDEAASLVSLPALLATACGNTQRNPSHLLPCNRAPTE